LMPARKKRLAGFVHDKSFLARRHFRLLVEDELVDDLELRTLQVAYRAETSALERQQLALRFEKLVRSRPHEELTMRQALYAGLGPGPDFGVGRNGLSRARLHELEASWKRWDRRHGHPWRVRHRAMHNLDRERAYRRLTGRRETNFNRIRAEIPDLEERARTELTLPDPPDPPGWEMVA
jgi:hypothetical protein